MSKNVRWSTVTVYEFGVGIGGSAVPRRGGPAVGLVRRPQSIWRTSVDAAQSELKADEQQTHADEAKEHKSVCHQRRRHVRWIKPWERVAMLEKAGYSEARIFRMLTESSSIAQSRRLCRLLECAA